MTDKPAEQYELERQGPVPNGYLWLPKTRAYRSALNLSIDERASLHFRCPYCGTTVEKKNHTDTCPLGGLERRIAELQEMVEFLAEYASNGHFDGKRRVKPPKRKPWWDMHPENVIAHLENKIRGMQP